MHDTSYNTMKIFLDKYTLSYYRDHKKVIDIGSRGRSGSYRALIPGTWKYEGIDINAGDNVDIVMPDPFTIPLPDDYADIALSGQCLEHCRNPFRLMQEACRVVKPRGWFFFVAPFIYKQHEGKHGKDFWRFLPSGFKEIFDEAGIEMIESQLIHWPHYRKGPYKNGKFSGAIKEPICDCWAIGRKM